MLCIRDLQIERRGASPIRLVDGVSLDVAPGKTVALVGESGSGKSLTSLAILGLLPSSCHVCAGRISLGETTLTALAPEAMRRMRGGRIAMIFQEPMTSLNPVLTVGEQIAEMLRTHKQMPRVAAMQRSIQLLARVGIPEPQRRIRSYPHEMSGGMRQRVMIAMAIACEPDVLIADEPTTALDVTIQRQILDLLRELQREANMGILLITHDLPLVAEYAEFVNVMYAGRIVEASPTAALFAHPRHPYTLALLQSVPRMSSGAESLPAAIGQHRPRMPVIPGDVPRPHARPSGCAFHPRCRLGRDDAKCRIDTPALLSLDATRACACWKVEPRG